MPAGRSEIFLKKRVGIIGGNLPGEKALLDAEKMGRLIAANGYILVNGGRGGVMEASARGAREAGGLVIGVLTGETRDEANPYVDIAVATGLGYIRNALVIMNSDVLVAIDGSHGTLSEIAYGNIYKKKVFGLDTWDVEGVIPLSSPEEVMGHIKQILQ